MEEIRCEEVRKLLGNYRQALLNPPEKGQVERHLFYCADCVNQLAAQTANEDCPKVFLFS
jgi:hypothetical protein